MQQLLPRISLVGAALATCAATASHAVALDLLVPPGGSIQAAIDIAFGGDRVLVPPGTYLERLDLAGKAIEVLGVQGAAVTIIDAGYSGVAVSLVNGEGPATVLRGLTITHGAGGFGPGGVVTNGTPQLVDCVITGNTGRLGAGVHGNPTLLRCRVEHNTSSLNHGGGLWGAPTLIECVVSSNACTGAKGGGLYITGGAAVLTDTRIEGNSAVLAGSRGGGVFVASTGSATFERCVIAGNVCSGGTFGSYAGGVFAVGPTTLTRCTIVGNRLSTGALAGGGVWGAASLVDCIVRDNDAEQLVGAALVRYCDVEGGFSGLGNFDADPMFWDPAALDFHLRAGSPCIDAGDPTGPLDPDGTRGDVGARAFDPNYVPAPRRECSASANSSGDAAAIDVEGTWSLAANDLTLVASGCPANQFGLFLSGADAALTQVGGGTLCITGNLHRLPVVATDALGIARFAYDSSAPAPGIAPPTSGSTRRFQYWFREPPALGGSNLTDALAVTFAP
ncbi:MAG: right-handed parallel beta-helix repeat-containing protein [Planctomycetota bacterium]